LSFYFNNISLKLPTGNFAVLLVLCRYWQLYIGHRKIVYRWTAKFTV